MFRIWKPLYKCVRIVCGKQIWCASGFIWKRIKGRNVSINLFAAIKINLCLLPDLLDGRWTLAALWISEKERKRDRKSERVNDCGWRREECGWWEKKRVEGRREVGMVSEWSRDVWGGWERGRKKRTIGLVCSRHGTDIALRIEQRLLRWWRVGVGGGGSDRMAGPQLARQRRVSSFHDWKPSRHTSILFLLPQAFSISCHWTNFFLFSYFPKPWIRQTYGRISTFSRESLRLSLLLFSFLFFRYLLVHISLYTNI